MITRKDVMPVNFLKKEKFTGSDTGMRYRMEMTKREVPERRRRRWRDGRGDSPDRDIVAGTIWIRRNAGRGETREEFPFSEEGIVSGVEWLNGQHARYVKPEK